MSKSRPQLSEVLQVSPRGPRGGLESWPGFVIILCRFLSHVVLFYIAGESKEERQLLFWTLSRPAKNLENDHEAT